MQIVLKPTYSRTLGIAFAAVILLMFVMCIGLRMFLENSYFSYVFTGMIQVLGCAAWLYGTFKSSGGYHDGLRIAGAFIIGLTFALVVGSLQQLLLVWVLVVVMCTIVDVKGCGKPQENWLIRMPTVVLACGIGLVIHQVNFIVFERGYTKVFPFSEAYSSLEEQTAILSEILGRSAQEADPQKSLDILNEEMSRLSPEQLVQLDDEIVQRYNARASDPYMQHYEVYDTQRQKVRFFVYLALAAMALFGGLMINVSIVNAGFMIGGALTTSLIFYHVKNAAVSNYLQFGMSVLLFFAFLATVSLVMPRSMPQGRKKRT